MEEYAFTNIKTAQIYLEGFRTKKKKKSGEYGRGSVFKELGKG